MALARTEKIAVSSRKELDGLDLTPEEYFVLSRISGTISLADLSLSCGMDSHSIESIVSKLMHVGAVVRLAELTGVSAKAGVAGGDGARPKGPTNAIQRRAQTRRARLLAAHLDRSKGPVPELEAWKAHGPPSPIPDSPTATDTPAKAPKAEVSLEWLPAIAATDPRVDAGLGLAVDDQKILLALEVAMADDPESMLVGAGCRDDSELRALFLDLSRRVHPDCFYGLEVGEYRVLADRLFAGLRRSYDVQRRKLKPAEPAGADARRSAARSR